MDARLIIIIMGTVLTILLILMVLLRTRVPRIKMSELKMTDPPPPPCRPKNYGTIEITHKSKTQHHLKFEVDPGKIETISKQVIDTLSSPDGVMTIDDTMKLDPHSSFSAKARVYIPFHYLQECMIVYREFTYDQNKK